MFFFMEKQQQKQQQQQQQKQQKQKQNIQTMNKYRRLLIFILSTTGFFKEFCATIIHYLILSLQNEIRVLHLSVWSLLRSIPWLFPGQSWFLATKYRTLSPIYRNLKLININEMTTPHRGFSASCSN